MLKISIGLTCLGGKQLSWMGYLAEIIPIHVVLAHKYKSVIVSGLQPSSVLTVMLFNTNTSSVCTYSVKKISALPSTLNSLTSTSSVIKLNQSFVIFRFNSFDLTGSSPLDWLKYLTSATLRNQTCSRFILYLEKMYHAFFHIGSRLLSENIYFTFVM